MNTYKLQQMNNEIFRKNSIDLTDLSMIVNDSFNNTNNDNYNNNDIKNHALSHQVPPRRLFP